VVRALVLWLFPLTLAAQDSRCTVEGMVVNASTGEGLRRAVVTLRRTDSTRNQAIPLNYTAPTDSEGKYAFTGVEPGTYLLSAERTGFAASRSGGAVKLESGQKASGLKVMMTPQAVIAGRVVDEEGEPLVKADVQISSLGYYGGQKQLSRAGGATTNDLGEYRVFGLAPGRYFVSVAARSNPLAAPSDDYVTTYYPRTTDPGAAVPLQVPAGAQMRNIDVTMATARTVIVRGKVTCEIEGQKRTIFVTLAPRMAMGIATMGVGSRGATIRPDGAFEIARVVPGGYMLIASAVIDDKRYQSRASLQVGGTNLEGVEVHIRPGATVTGRLHVEGRDQEQLDGVSVTLQSWESGGIIYGPMPVSKTRADGSFQLEEINVDRYTLSLSGLPDGYYVKSVRSGGSDVMAAGLRVDGGAAPLDVLISPSAGAVEGTVSDPRSDKAFPGATVVLIPQAAERSELYQRTTTDQEGHFRIRNVVPGEYKVYAWEEVPAWAWMDPDFMRGMAGKGDAVSVTEGAVQQVQGKLILDR
jgi:protocatechuate 3,4-dioxygenase beta subunit